jgi:hypothetical protein
MRSATAGESGRGLQWTCFHKVKRSIKAAGGWLDRLVRPPNVADEGELEAAHGVCAKHDARPHAGLPSIIVIPVGDGVSIARVSLKPAAL